ncbi:MAG: helix-turn-helix domain-containing protein [Clostridium sp.]|nr:helix-turn-helix domain-containing protein [Clostridium sp.]
MNEKQQPAEKQWAERCSYKLDMVLSRIDKIISMLFHTKTVLTTDEAAMYLGVTTGHLYRMVRKHNIPHTRPTNGKIYFQKTELGKWLRPDAQPEAEFTENNQNIPEQETEHPIPEMYI